jgi:hypothetical protein
VIGVTEACEDVEVVIDRANGVDRHFYSSISDVQEFSVEAAHIATSREDILPY